MDQAIEERLAIIETIVLRLEERLFGNGQPGEIAKIKDRLSKVESWFWRLVGAAGTILVLLEMVDRVPRLFHP